MRQVRALARFRVAAFTAIALIALARSAKSQAAHTPVQELRSPLATQTIPAHPLPDQALVTVMLELSGDPVAVVRSRAPRKQLAQLQEAAIADNLRARQDALVPLIEARGAKVLAKVQYALNAIKVRGTPAQIAALAQLPGVIAVKPVLIYHLDNAESVPFIGTPAVWQGPPGFHGETIKVAIIDTGIDYTHADFGGPGTVAAFQTAKATSTQPADPTLFGPSAPKVKGGTDLVGDNYNASSSDPAKNTPVPDPNPLDCAGHGSHVAGTAAGFGVLSNGTTYPGPYDSTTPSNSFLIGPGVAPRADIYAVRVFGCSGSTNVVVEAIDWAVANHMQVINLSLGSDFGTKNTADADAATNAASAGILLSIAAGNAGPVPYIVGSPATADKVITVAAMDSHQSNPFPGANMVLNTGQTIPAQNSNAATFADGTQYPIVVLRNPDGSISLGCTDSEYVNTNVMGKLVVTLRGNCPRIQRAQSGQAHGAAAVAMINNAAGYPPFEGPISGVTIPFFGVLQSDAGSLAAATTATVTNSVVPNPTFRQFASFTSQGPRQPDGNLKPDITAPGVSIFSTASGTGNGGLFESGTSMAAPHVAGVAALARQAHSTWDPDDVRMAIVNTADATQLIGYSTRLGGAGLVQPLPATLTSVVARGNNDAPSLSFGVQEFSSDFQQAQDITVKNLGTQSASFSITTAANAGVSPHSVQVTPSTLTLPAGQTAPLHVQLTIPAASNGDSSAFRDVAGLVNLTPVTSGDNGGVALHVPYHVVPRARSLITTSIGAGFGPINPSTTTQVLNASTAVTGSAEFYAWGLSGQHANLGDIGLRAVGAESFPDNLGREIIVFAVNTFAPWSTADSINIEFDVLVDVNGDGKPDYDIFSRDAGIATGTGAFTGQPAVVVFNLATNTGVVRFFAIAPTNGSTILLPILASDIGITPTNPRFTYSAESFEFPDVQTLISDSIPGPAPFNAFNNAISTDAFVNVGPSSAINVFLSIDPNEWLQTPAKGAMVVSLDNFSGGTQAQLFPVFQSLAATPASASIFLNQTQPFVATGTYSDASTRDLTSTVSWASSDTSVATINSSGLATPLKPGGPVTISAKLGNAVANAHLTVNPFTTATALVLSSSPNPVYGDLVTFTAAVSVLSPGTGPATGNVTFTDGAVTLGTVTLNGGSAALTTSSPLSGGTHVITASYLGDTDFTASTATLNQTIAQATTTVDVGVSVTPPAQAIFRQPVTFTVTVVPSTDVTPGPSGTVTFMDGSRLLGSAILNAGQATFTTKQLGVGRHSVTATYVGDGNFTGSFANTTAFYRSPKPH